MVHMASREGRRHHHDLVPLAALISREMRNEKMEKPNVRFGQAAQSRKGEDYFLIKTDCQRVPGNPSSTFSVFAVNLALSRVDIFTLCDECLASRTGTSQSTCMHLFISP